MNNPNRLCELFRMQRAFNARIGVHTEPKTEEEKTKWSLKCCRTIGQELELAELPDSVPGKGWAKPQPEKSSSTRMDTD